MICPKCGTEYPSNITECKFCNLTLIDINQPSSTTAKPQGIGYGKVCPNDGTEYPSNMTKCPWCLSELVDISRPSNDETKRGATSEKNPNQRRVSAYTTEYPWHSRSTRTRHALPTGEIIIPQIPSLGQTPTINWMAVLAPPVGMALIIIVMSAILSSSSSSSFLLFMLPMQLISVGVSIFNYRSQKKKHGKDENDINKRYEALLAEQEQKLKQITDVQKRILDDENPFVAECFRIVEDRSRHLWERVVEEDDYLRISVGNGPVKLCVPIKAPEKQGLQVEANLEIKARDLAKKYSYINSSQVLCDLHAMPTLGVIGDRQAAIAIVKKIIINISTLHSYEDVKIIMLYPPSEANIWDVFRFLPHVFDERHEARYMADDRVSAAQILDMLNNSLEDRYRSLNNSYTLNAASNKPHFILLCADPVYMQKEPILDYLIMNNISLGVSSIFLYSNHAQLPPKCSQIIDSIYTNGEIRGCMYASNNVDNRQLFVSEQIDTQNVDRFVRTMAPIRVRTSENETSLPNSISLLQAHKVRNPNSLPILENWKHNHACEGMSVPIGINSKGELFMFDIHEKKCGPMGLIAGTCRSGKTELLQTWVTEMAMAYSPDEVSFALIDFKGSGLTSPFEGLPHLAGAISNLDVDSMRDDFILRYTESLRKEIERRQTILRNVDCDGNILKYHRKYHENIVRAPLPFLMIVIDEFAEIKSQYPDFMKLVESLYATGGSLGMYVLLATQNPESAINVKIQANTSFQWCMRVTTAQDSRSMLGVPDAFNIPELPGRGFIRVDKMRVLECIQSLFSGAPYDPQKDLLSNEIPVALVQRNGTKLYVEDRINKSHIYTAEVDVIINFVNRLAAENGYEPAYKIWHSSLPKLEYLSHIEHQCFDGQKWNNEPTNLFATVGIADSPAHQEIRPLIVDFSTNGHGIVYGAPMVGKSTFLYTVANSLVTKYSPESLCLYLVDYNSGNLSIFQEFPHVADSINLYDDQDRLETIINLIEKEIKDRGRRFASMHVATYRAYCDTKTDTDPQLPYIVLILDGIGEVRKLYPDITDSFLSKLTKDGASKGIYLLASASEERDTFKITSSIKPNMRFVLQMANKADYSSILGAKGTTPSCITGRGVCRQDASVIEFQTALPENDTGEAERMKNLQSLGFKMQNNAKHSNRRIVPQMPEVIPYGSIQVDTVAPILGLSTTEIVPIIHDFSVHSGILYMGEDVEHATTCMKAIIKQLFEKQHCKSFIGYNLPETSLTIEEMNTPEEFEKKLANLAELLRERLQIWKEDKRGTFDPCVIAIGDLPGLLTQVNEETNKLLSSILRNGKVVCAYLLCSGCTNDIQTLYQEGDEIIRRFFNRGVVLVDSNFEQYKSFLNEYIHSITPTGDDWCYLSYSAESGQMKAVPFRAMSSD